MTPDLPLFSPSPVPLPPMVQALTSHELVGLLLALGLLLAVARVLGELAKALGQPAVLGELLAGLLLGQSIFGRFAPEAFGWIFPSAGGPKVFLDSLGILAVTLFLLVSGMEVNLETLWRQGRVALSVSLWGMLFPFACGFLAAWTFPRLLGHESSEHLLVFALFFATALAISALPVIAKTLMDLGLYRTDLGMVVIAAAVVDDLFGWVIFAIVLGLLNGEAVEGLAVGRTVLTILGFALFMLTLGRWLLHQLLRWVQNHSSWPGGVIGFTLALTLFFAAFTEWIGVHTVFGAFLFGVALGDSSRLREQTRDTLDRFISFFFAPIFFAGIGIQVDFFGNFDLLLVLTILTIAIFGKVIGCGLGGRLSGLPWNQAWAVGFGMNSRGAMEIILGLLALQAGLITQRMFVALVVMALVTSLISGPMMKRLLIQKGKGRRFFHYLNGKTFCNPLTGRDKWEVIGQLSAKVGAAYRLDPRAVEAVVVEREKTMSTGLTKGVAIPHGRLAGLKEPVVALGFSRMGIDFNSLDGSPVYLVVMILTPLEDADAQIHLLAEVARTFKSLHNLGEVAELTDFGEFLAWLKAQVE